MPIQEGDIVIRECGILGYWGLYDADSDDLIHPPVCDGATALIVAKRLLTRRPGKLWQQSTDHRGRPIGPRVPLIQGETLYG